MPIFGIEKVIELLKNAATPFRIKVHRHLSRKQFYPGKSVI